MVDGFPSAAAAADVGRYVIVKVAPVPVRAETVPETQLGRFVAPRVSCLPARAISARVGWVGLFARHLDYTRLWLFSL